MQVSFERNLFSTHFLFIVWVMVSFLDQNLRNMNLFTLIRDANRHTVGDNDWKSGKTNTVSFPA